MYNQFIGNLDRRDKQNVLIGGKINIAEEWRGGGGNRSDSSPRLPNLPRFVLYVNGLTSLRGS